MPEIRVQDEQGNIHVFPDGSTPEMISQAMGLKPDAPSAPTLTNQQPSIVDQAMSPVGDIGRYAGATRDAVLDVAGKLNSPGAWLARKLNPNDTSIPSAGERGSDYVQRMASQGPDPNHPIMRAAQVGIAGAARDTADLGASLTSPVALATMGAGVLGKSGKAAQTLVGTGFGLKGASDVLTNTPAALSGDPDAAQKALYGGAMIAGGAAGAKEGVQKATNVAAKSAARSGVEAVLQPAAKQFRFGKDPVGFVVDNGISANSFQELHSKIGDVVNDKSNQLDTALKQTPATVSLAPAKKLVTDAIKTAMQERDAGSINKLTDLYQRLNSRLVPGQNGVRNAPSPGNVPALEAAQIKRGIQKSINWSDESAKTVNNVMLKVQHEIGDGLHQAVPATAALDESISSGIEAQKATEVQWLKDQAGKRTVKNSTRATVGGVLIGGAIGGPTGAAMGAGIGKFGAKAMGYPTVGTFLSKVMKKP